MIGAAVSSYTLLRKLGGGGMGMVYEAQDNRLGRHVALKFLPDKLARVRYAMERLQLEARAASSLNHPNICTIHDVGTHDEKFFIVMELIEGEPLTNVIQGRPLPLEKVLQLSIDIADALEYAHQRGIIHCDVKPGNIFVTQRGAAKVVDFGLAKICSRRLTDDTIDAGLLAAASAQRNAPVGAEFAGTIAYMSPEQARGDVLDNRTDLFSLGIVLYQMATGVLPFQGDTSAVVFDAILNRTPPSVTGLNTGLPAGLDRIISRALQKEPSRRYASAGQMREELSQLLDSSVSIPVSPVTAAIPRPGRIVLLYRRNSEPDTQVLELLETRLIEKDYDVFVDRHLLVGMQWAREIEQRISSADAVVAILSPASVQSEMFAYEIQIANEAAQRQGGKPRILPIRVNFEGLLPDQISGILEGTQYVNWNGLADDDRLIDELLKSLESPIEIARPVKLEAVGGAVPLESEFYVLRTADAEFLDSITRCDSIVLLKGARQMGKTSLMARGLQLARRSGARVVLTDFQKLNSAHMESVGSLFRTLAESIADQLDLNTDIDLTWNPKRGPSMNFERFIRREVLGKLPGRLVWGMDEVDRLFSCSFASEVFGLFRSWHNERSLDPSGPWQKLTMVIAYATEAHMFITDMNQSPFNVGTRLLLEDFSMEQVRELNERYGGPLKKPSEFKNFLHLLGGQPYLSRRALNEMASHRLDFETMRAQAIRDDGPFGDHLRRVLVSLAQDAGLCETVQTVLKGKPSGTTEDFYRLRSAGIVSGESTPEMKFRCQLYEMYLRRHLT
jgi:serine/threonine protein kinase